jgi:predicted 2-oxoglutarate/Fe(II)-dependent dioxygenase YbiX
MSAGSLSAFEPSVDHAVPPPLQPGERMPFWYGMAGGGGFFSLESLAGAPAIIVLAHGVPRDDLGALVAPLAIAARRAVVVILGSDDTVLTLRDDPAAHGMRLVDCNPAQLGPAGVGPDARSPARILVVDRNQRIALHLAAAPGTDLAAACLRALDTLPQEAGREMLMPAPALLLPNLLSAAQCRHLIARFESGATIDSGMATIDEHGQPRTRLDHAKKRRRDLLIGPDDPDHDTLQALLLRRCAPEIARAFQASIAHTDRILVACYDDTGGYFRRHRDNAGEHVAFREFAISVNLNTEEYEGGGLLFPECNDHLYRPPTGAGFIFSTSLLHEATPVTRGRRYVLLTFFHSEAAERRRRAA